MMPNNQRVLRLPGGIVIQNENEMDEPESKSSKFAVGPGSIGSHNLQNTMGIYHLDQADRKALYQKCSTLAKVFAEQGDDKRMVFTAASSKNRDHRAAAALYWGIVKEVDDTLLNAIEDKDPFVCHAAYESCCKIAKDVYNTQYPFESTHKACEDEKDSVKHMTDIYFKSLKTKKPAIKPKQKTPAEILGLE